MEAPQDGGGDNIGDQGNPGGATDSASAGSRIVSSVVMVALWVVVAVLALAALTQ